MARKRKANAVGRHANFSAVDISGIQEAIADAVSEYSDQIYQATEDAVDAAAYYAKDALAASSPNRTGMYAKRWKVIGKGKYKLCRFIGNSTTVTDKKGENISLANIFEYSTQSKHQGEIKQTIENNADGIANAMISALKQEV